MAPVCFLEISLPLLGLYVRIPWKIFTEDNSSEWNFLVNGMKPHKKFVVLGWDWNERY